MTGPSGVGKGTLISRLLASVEGIEESVSATTRAQRPGEREGVDYFFVPVEEFERRVRSGDFLEHAEYAGNMYGTLRSEVERRLAQNRSVIMEIELEGARQVRREMPESVAIFIKPPSVEVLERRLRGRGTDSDAGVLNRLRTARRELAAETEFDHVVLNEDLESAAQELERIVRAELSTPESARP